MNYLTNYYKNLSEQLQERINLLEAQIYDDSAKVATANLINQMYRDKHNLPWWESDIIDSFEQGSRRYHDKIKIESILQNKSHPIHQNLEHLTALRSVYNDMQDKYRSMPGSDLSRRIMRSDRHRRGIERSPTSALPYSSDNNANFGSRAVGWWNVRPEDAEGAQPEEMRFVVDLLKGKYDPNKKIFNTEPNHDTNPTDEVPVYGEHNAPPIPGFEQTMSDLNKLSIRPK